MRIAVYSFVLFSLIALCLSLHLYNLQISFIFTYYYSFVPSPIPITLARFYPPFLISLSLSLTQSPLTLSPHPLALLKSLSLLSVSFLSFLSSLYYLYIVNFRFNCLKNADGCHSNSTNSSPS